MEVDDYLRDTKKPGKKFPLPVSNTIFLRMHIQCTHDEEGGDIRHNEIHEWQVHSLVPKK